MLAPESRGGSIGSKRQPLDYARLADAARPPFNRRGCVWVLATMGVLLVVGAAFVIWINESYERYEVTVVVVNESGTTLRAVEFEFGGRTTQFSQIPAGARVSQAMHVRGTGTMRYTVTRADGGIVMGSAGGGDPDGRDRTHSVRVRASDVLPQE